MYVSYRHYSIHKYTYLKIMWSRKHEKCIDCGTTELPHYGNGRCFKCYGRAREKRRKLDPVYRLERKKIQARYYQKMRKDLKRREASLKKLREYKAYRLKTDPEFKKRKNQLNKESTARRKKTTIGKRQFRLIAKKDNERRRFIKFMEGKSRKEKEGVTIVCYGCKKECQIVSPITDINNQQEKMKRFRRFIINHCKQKI